VFYSFSLYQNFKEYILIMLIKSCLHQGRKDTRKERRKGRREGRREGGKERRR
jgi:hypothetical protein